MGFGIRVKFAPNVQPRAGGGINVVGGTVGLLQLGSPSSEAKRDSPKPARLPVLGAPPGMGSLYGNHGGESTFYIDDEPRPRNPSPTDPRGENFALFQWFRREFGAAFKEDPLHYVDYNELRKAALPDPGFRTERYAMFFDVEQRDPPLGPKGDFPNKGSLVLRLPTGLEIHRRVQAASEPRRTYRRPTPFSFAGLNGHLYPVNGHGLQRVERRGPNTVVLVAPDATLDSAAFVGSDGSTRWLTRPSGGTTFSLATAPLPVESPVFSGGSQWRPPRTVLSPIIDGVIESVTPRFFW